MKPIDMSAEAVSRRLIRQSQLRNLCLGLAGQRRRPLSSFGPLIPLDGNGEPITDAQLLRETSPPYRTDSSTS
jgi:hypothetical protein